MVRESSSIDKLIRRQIKLTILSVIAVVLITSTITYALYQTNHENTTDQVISIGNLGLTATGTPITLEGLYPMEEFDLTSSYPRYEFTLENKTNGVNNDYTLMYELVLRADENTTLSQDDYQYIMYKIDGSEAKALSEVWDSEINGFKILDGRLLSNAEATGRLAGKDKENHNIVFWLSTYTPNNMQGKVLTLKMSLEAYADRFNYLKAQTYTGDIWDSTFAVNDIFGKTIDRGLFETIHISTTNVVPSDTIESWDISQKQNRSIMAWYTDADNNGLYELYIGQKGGVIANPNSSCLFARYTKLTNIYGLENLITDYVTNMQAMFKYSSHLLNLEINHFNVSNVTNMHSAFAQCGQLISLDLSKWNTKNIKSVVCMFWDCSNITSINIENFDLTKITYAQSMFNNCNRLELLNIKNVIFEKNISAPYMFAYTKQNIKVITNEHSEEFIKARLKEENITKAALDVTPCIKVNYSYNINDSNYSNIAKILIGDIVQIAPIIDARPGYTFVGWNTKSDGSGITFKQGEEVDISVLKSLDDDAITLYAMWEES